MRTLGIDLASKPKKTAVCEIDWQTDAATVTNLELNVSDRAILSRVAELKLAKAERGVDFSIGIDAPFGWPRPFVAFLNRVEAGDKPFSAWDADTAKKLCYRLTDLRVNECLGLVPLSVSADKIARPAMRCSLLLWKLGVTDRSGTDGVFEVYPSAALKAWGFPFAGFGPGAAKGPEALAEASLLVRDKCSSWLRFSSREIESMLEKNDDAFASFVASLATRAAALGRTCRPRSDDEWNQARVEGWIAFPRQVCSIKDLLVESKPA